MASLGASRRWIVRSVNLAGLAGDLGPALAELGADRVEIDELDLAGDRGLAGQQQRVDAALELGVGDVVAAGARRCWLIGAAVTPVGTAACSTSSNSASVSRLNRPRLSGSTIFRFASLGGMRRIRRRARSSARGGHQRRIFV